VNKLLKVAIGIVASLVLLAVAGVSYLKLAFPRVGPAPDMKVELTPARLQRGEYLVRNVADCAGCHSPRLTDEYGLPFDETKTLTGGFEISKLLADIPGEVTSPNLTPVHLASWTDGEVYRAIAEGVNKDGRPLFPMMPYLNFGKLDKEDVLSIIAYLRSLKPAGVEQPASRLAFPFSLIARTIPVKAAHVTRPDPQNSVASGEYLVRAAGCFECHTPVDDHHQPLPGMQGAGGLEFKAHVGDVRFVVRPPNITPDPDTGIGAWDKSTFVAAIRTRAALIGRKTPLGEPNHVMPYRELARMTDQDLGAIYDYLRTLKPVNNKVTRYERL
jgi:mono/diheme cytochrome c family protein